MKLTIDVNVNWRKQDSVLESIEQLYSLLKTIKKTMATKEQLTAAFDRMQAAHADLAGDIRSLKDQLENAGVDQAFVDRAESIASALEALASETPGQTGGEEEQPPRPIEDEPTAPDVA